MNTPVAIIVFNRPDCTSEILKVLQQIKPTHLLVIADGPRPHVPGDAARCIEVRQLIDEMVNWNCRVDKNYSDFNLGCKRRPETGIDWVFDQVEEAIILEDDCLPDQSFFPYCQSLLQKYRYDERIMMISGYCFFDTPSHRSDSYYFSYLASTWGWATWRRAWRLNDPFLDNWSIISESKLIEKLFPEKVHSKYWYDVFARILDGRLSDAWDYQWQLACWANSGYRIFPKVNLIKNIGHGADATHTFSPNIYSNELKTIELPLNSPQIMTRSYDSDRQIMNSFCLAEGYLLSDFQSNFFRHGISLLKHYMRRIYYRLKR